jgi:serine/threonine protein kinase
MFSTTTEQTVNAAVKLEQKSKKIGKYVLLGTLGKGKFKVKKALDVQSSKVVALKLFRKNEYENKPNYEQEKTAYSKLRHKNTLRMVDSFEDFYYINDKGSVKRFNVLVLEYAAKGDLFSYIEKTKAFDEKTTRHIFSQAIDGLQHVHDGGYAHLDLKLENIYFDQDHTVKIADFDLARPMTGKDFNPRRIGSINYMAPEILEDRCFNGVKVDIFALGVLLFCLQSSKLPFVSAKASDPWYKHIRNNDFETFWELHERRGIKFPTSLKNLISAMLSYDPHRRPSLMAIKSSAFMKGEYPTATEYSNEMERRFQQF